MIATPKSSTTTLRFLDGTFVVISGTSVLRYMSDVRFIRFSVLAGAVYAAFLSYEFNPTLSDPQNFAVYALLAVSLLGWLAISSCLLFYFAKRNWVRAVFTPVIFLPIPMIAALVIALAAPLISSSILEFSELSAPLILRQLAVVVCLDMIHTRFVVPMHSKVLTIKLRGLFSLTGVPNPTNHPNPSIAIDQPSVSPIRIVQPSKTVAIGSQVFNRDSLVSIRVEKK
ncbi:hypothetical protein [Planktotalea sp.]|uniref:hypothetical protein n=1 Tax=Planktotalea sp. TaxID=2029877 RepID=UPI0025EE59E6|nr:hypothetical protein [Planktotalea sp.]